MSFTILVVEDDDSVREHIKFLLERAGYRVILAVDGAEALNRVDEEIPHLILLDLSMPHMDGFQFADEFHRRGLRSMIPIISVSAHGSLEEMGQLAEQLGAVGFVRKPFKTGELLAEVKRIANLAS